MSIHSGNIRFFPIPAPFKSKVGVYLPTGRIVQVEVTIDLDKITREIASKTLETKGLAVNGQFWKTRLPKAERAIITTKRRLSGDPTAL